ncbi:MAG: PD40 domain-containing protein [Lentisphaerae bacterium]|nr:PD40 domain-containing protein [Lentisphaerota bacterium]
MILREDLLPDNAPDGLEVIQITTNLYPSSHIYMEAQIFTPDSKRFLLHGAGYAHGSSDGYESSHHYMVCDIEDHCLLHTIIEEKDATAPTVSPDGKYIYYFVDEGTINGGKIMLKRVGIDGSDRQTLLVIDSPIPGVNRSPSRLYPLSTIRADGRKLAISSFLGNGQADGILWGLLIFDLAKNTCEVILTGQTWCNMHPQYCRSSAPEHMQDILIQENHGNKSEPGGEILELCGSTGADIHLIKDDGTNFRNMPWGRDGNEFCQGHQCWRGTSEWAITSTMTKSPPELQLIESRSTPFAEHNGIVSSGGIRNNISRSFPRPCFNHFATDIAGTLLVTDTSKTDMGGRVLVAHLGQAGKDAASSWTCVAHPGSSWAKKAHIHPFLSPDGTKAFFNSDESGLVQAYMVRGIENLNLNKPNSRNV